MRRTPLVASLPLAAGGRRPWAAWRRHAPLAVWLGPAAALLTLFYVLPALWAVYASLTDLSLADVGSTGSHFVGLANYRALWRDPNFSRVVRNSVVFVVGSATVGQIGLGLALALLLDVAQTRRYRLTGVAYGAVLLAWISPVLVGAFVWARLLAFDDGAVNGVLVAVGRSRVDWLGRFPMAAVVVADVWRGTAFSMLIFLGALRAVPRDALEAARVDGAGGWRRFRDHVLPAIRPFVGLALLATTITTFGSFLLILALTNGGPGFLETETLALYAYHNAFTRFALGYGSAIAVVMLLLNVGFAAVYARALRARA